VIPTLILFGVVFGRWWRFSLIAAVLGWPILLVVSDVMSVDAGLVGAAGLALANTGIGVLVHQGGMRAVRFLRYRRAHSRTV
jgi:hypothetical protein